jgi:hypothetical protein
LKYILLKARSKCGRADETVVKIMIKNTISEHSEEKLTKLPKTFESFLVGNILN